MPAEHIHHIIVDKYHVGTSDRELIRDIIHTRPAYRVRGNRYTKWRAWMTTNSRESRHQFLRNCLEAHHENQHEYAWVMRGGM